MRRFLFCHLMLGFWVHGDLCLETGCDILQFRLQGTTLHACATWALSAVSHWEGPGLSSIPCTECLDGLSNFILNLFDEHRMMGQGGAVQAEHTCAECTPAAPLSPTPTQCLKCPWPPSPGAYDTWSSVILKGIQGRHGSWFGLPL